VGTDDVERALAAAGEGWRAGQPPPPEVDTSRFFRPVTPAARVWAPIAAVAGVAAVLAVVVLPLAFGGGGGVPVGAEPSPDPALTPPASAAPVEGFGTLLREADGTTKLCQDLMVQLSLPPAGAGCSSVFVLVTGAGDEWFTEEATSGQRWSQPVRVEGGYGGGTLTVNRIEPFTPDYPAYVEPPVPCEPPSAGWKAGRGVDTAFDEAAVTNALTEHVRANPTRYTDLWEAHPDGTPTDASYRAVYVVGTTGDVDAARAELSAIYPGNLCVHPVQYSASKLNGIAEQLRSVSSTPIQAEALVIENKVRVNVVALDPPTSAILDGIGREALIIDEPLLKWLD
jgi:hypothetical protein